MDVQRLELDASVHLTKGHVIDVWRLELRLPSLAAGGYVFDNPLGTEADIVDLVVEGEAFDSSPFLRVWDQRLRDRFASQIGLWFWSSAEGAHLVAGSGDPALLPDLLSEEEREVAQFFVAQSDLPANVDVRCVLTLTCMN